MSDNRPYIFELAGLLLDAAGSQDAATSITDAAIDNGVELAELTRATEILLGLAREGRDVAEWIRGEYFIDGWLHGYLPLSASPADASLTTWTLAQLAFDYHGVS